MITRRQLLKSVAGAAVTLPFWDAVLGTRPAWALDGTSRRLIVFYFPDGVPGVSSNGEPSLWHASGGETSYTMPELLSPLSPFRDDLILFRGLSMGPTDSGSHPGGAKKLLTGVDGGFGESIDQVLARTVGASSVHRHLYLGVQATHNGATGDKHISYISPGVTTTPQDNPRAAFERLFGGGTVGGGTDPESERRRQLRLSVLDGAMDDLADLRGRLGTTEQARLGVHLDALREVESRLQNTDVGPSPATCSDPAIDTSSGEPSTLYDPDMFPAELRAQLDIMVTAMSCGLSRVGVVQASMHTSELIMSRFPGTELYDPGYDMRSHQASHYGASHDFGHREFADYVTQRRWWLQQFAYLLESLRSRPEGDGTMLDYSTVLLCTEVADGNTHLHDDMPFIVAGRGGGSLRTGRLLDVGYRRHGDMLAALGRSLGADMNGFGQDSGEALAGMLA